MKAIGCILCSYLHRRFFILGLLVVDAYLLIIANVLIGFYPRAAWCFFLYSLTLVAAIIGFHLRQMLESSTADMLPNHRRYQLIAAGLIFAVFMAWPALLTFFWGGPVLATLAIYLFFVLLGLAASFFSAKAGGVSVALGTPLVYWLFYDIYRLAGASPGISRIAALRHHAGSFWPVYLIAASAFGLLLFVIFYLRISHAKISNESSTDYLQCLATHDWVGPVAVKRASNAISRLARAKNDQRSSLFRSARLLQFSLFSPVYALNFYGYGIFPFALLYTYLSFHQEGRFRAPAMNFFLPFGYFLFTAVLAADFLSHRNRLPSVYLQSDLPSRSAFAWTTVLSYLLVVCKQMIGITGITALIHAVFPWATWTHFFPLCVIGFLLSLIQVSLSLLAGTWVKPSSGLVWVSVNSLVALVILPLTRLYSGAWTVIAVIALFSALLFCTAMRKWLRTEMDAATRQFE